MFTSKEQLLYFFLTGKISLSQYDYKFMSNLQSIIRDQGRITTNQATLFDTLIGKYQRQLKKNHYEESELLALHWNISVLESSVEFTGASVFMQEDYLVLKVPFNKQFINSFRNVVNNPFVWNKEEKSYFARFSTTALKLLTVHLSEFFTSVTFSEELTSILTDLKQYEVEVWNPTLIKTGDKYVVGACNEIIGEKIKSIQLDKSMNTLFTLSSMGVKIDPSVHENEPMLKFASERVYETEITDVEQVISWMKMIGVENVILGRGLKVRSNSALLTQLIQDNSMNPIVSFHGTLPVERSAIIQHTSVVDMRTNGCGKIYKIILLKDSRPIGVK